MRKRLLIAVILLVTCVMAHGGPNDKRIAEIQQEMASLGPKLLACKGNADCMKPIQQQMELLAKEYSELTSPGGAIPDPCATDPNPCCGTERTKQYIRDNYHVEPTWVQCKPVQFEFVWDMHEESHTSEITYTLRQVFPGYLSMTYDQKDKKRLIGFTIAGPVPKDNTVQNSIVSVSGAFTPGNAKTVKTRASSNPNDYLPRNWQGVTFEWSSDSGANMTVGGITPWPKAGFCQKGCVEYDCDFGYIRLSGKGGKAITNDDLEKALKVGSYTKEYKINEQLAGIEWKQSGKLTLTIDFNPEPGLEVTPGEAYHAVAEEKTDKVTPTTKTYTLKNAGKSKIHFKVSENSFWLKVFPESGDLLPGGKVDVIVGVDPDQTKQMEAGTYKDTLLFMNTTNQKGSTARPVELKIEQAP